LSGNQTERRQLLKVGKSQMKTTTQPKTGQPCTCKPGQARDNCTLCEGTGQRIDFAKIRGETMPRTAHDAMPGEATEPPVSLGADCNGNPYMARGSYRTKDGKAQIDWELAKHKEHGGALFSACGTFEGGGGQCIDRIAEAYPDDPKVQEIAGVWEKYHLNDMKAGTPEQVAFLKARETKYPDDMKAAPYNGDHYAWAVGALKAAGLYEVQIERGTLQACGGFENRSDPITHKLLYRYGERWLFSPIPAEVVEQIKGWAAADNTGGQSHYDARAREFLSKHGIKLRITLSDSKPARWEPAGHHYRITLSRKNGAGRLAFDFWGSVNDAEAGKDPGAYDVLSCIGSDLFTPETFEDYCSEYGEEQDSRKALQTFNRAHEHAERLRAFFTDETEREELGEIC
jgi:hypothetical protein